MLDSLTRIACLFGLIACGAVPETHREVTPPEPVVAFRDGAVLTRNLTRDFVGSKSLYIFLMDRPVLTARCLMVLGLAPYQLVEIDKNTWQLEADRELSGVMTRWEDVGEKRLYHLAATGQGPLGMRLQGEALFEVGVEEINGTHLRQELRADICVAGFWGALLRLVGPWVAQSVDERLAQALGGGRELTRLLSEDPQKTLDALARSVQIEAHEIALLKNTLKKTSKLKP